MQDDGTFFSEHPGDPDPAFRERSEFNMRPDSGGFVDTVVFTAPAMIDMISSIGASFKGISLSGERGAGQWGVDRAFG
jgi:hypothetical protein